MIHACFSSQGEELLGCVYASWVFGCVFQVGGDEDEPEVGEEGLVKPVVLVRAVHEQARAHERVR